jgi:hypothetical protein
MQATCPGKSLNAGLTSRATITSPSSPTMSHARLNPRHSSTLYDAHEPRLGLGRGKLGKYSGILRQAQTTWREGQASRREQSNPDTRRLPQQGITTRLQCIPTDGDVRRDVPAAKHCNSFLLPLVPFPCDYKRERRAMVTRVRLSQHRTPPPGTWERTPSPDQLVTPTTSTPGSGTRQPRTGRRVLLLEGLNQYKSRCLLR